MNEWKWIWIFCVCLKHILSLPAVIEMGYCPAAVAEEVKEVVQVTEYRLLFDGWWISELRVIQNVVFFHCLFLWSWKNCWNSRHLNKVLLLHLRSRRYYNLIDLIALAQINLIIEYRSTNKRDGLLSFSLATHLIIRLQLVIKFCNQ